MKKVAFEMGSVSMTGNDEFAFCADHHSGIEAKDAFCVAKMASVQVLEWIVMKNINPSETEFVLNHTGHLDDFCLHAIAPAFVVGKLRSLYRFATTVSVLDSCGPTGYKLIQKKEKSMVDAIYGEYHRVLGELAKANGVANWKLPLKEKVKASKAAGALLIELLEGDDYEEARPWEPDSVTYRIIKDGEIVLVQGLDSGKFDPLQASAFFYARGAKAVVGFRREGDRYHYDICVRSNFDANLSALWPKLAKEEPDVPEGARNWGGHAGAGGSPRPEEKLGYEGGSVRDPEEILSEVSQFIF